jgi:hypothetical protein
LSSQTASAELRNQHRVSDPMASEIQYRVFREVHDEEAQRYSNLGTRSNLYLSIVTFYLGVVFLKIEDILKFAVRFYVPVIWFLILGILLVIAFLLVVRAISIHDYEGVFDPEGVIKTFGKSPPQDNDFLDDRIVDLAVATNRNSAQNNKVASSLRWAARIILMAVLLQLVLFGVAIIHGKDLAYEVQIQEKTNRPCGAGHCR